MGSDGEPFTMLFGDSYKTHLRQIQEFFWRTQEWINHKPHPKYKILDMDFCDDEWKSWGGLKWCLEENFQHELNREGCQSSDPDNPNPRQYAQMVFYPDGELEGAILKFYRDQYRDRALLVCA